MFQIPNQETRYSQRLKKNNKKKITGYWKYISLIIENVRSSIKLLKDNIPDIVLGNV